MHHLRCHSHAEVAVSICSFRVIMFACYWSSAEWHWHLNSDRTILSCRTVWLLLPRPTHLTFHWPYSLSQPYDGKFPGFPKLTDCSSVSIMGFDNTGTPNIRTIFYKRFVLPKHLRFLGESSIFVSLWKYIWRSLFQVPLWPPVGFVPSNPHFNSSAVLVHSQLVYFVPVGLLNMLSSLFQFIAWPQKNPQKQSVKCAFTFSVLYT